MIRSGPEAALREPKQKTPLNTAKRLGCRSQPRADTQLGAGPFPDGLFPGWPRHGFPLAQPSHDLTGSYKQESTHIGHNVVTVAVELLDGHTLIAEPPDLRHLQ